MQTVPHGKVLVVEDDESMRESIETLLDAAGIECAVFDSAEALLAADVAEARCVVSDLKLPAMSGLELLTELRSRGTDAPLILITAHDSVINRAEAKRKGAAAFLAKPFLGSALLAAIATLTEAASGV